MRKLLLTTAAALGVAASAGVAHATLSYTVWNGTLPASSHIANPSGVPGSSPFATFTSESPINFVNNGADLPNGANNTFAEFFSSNGTNPAGIPSSLTPLQRATIMSTLDTQIPEISTFIRITESFSLAATGTVPLSITHDDGGTIYIDGAYACGNPAESSVTTQSCTSLVSAGTHSLSLYYAEDNGAPAVLVASIPSETAIPEPVSLALLGTGLLGLGVARRLRKSS